MSIKKRISRTAKRPIKAIASVASPWLVERLLNMLVYGFVRNLDFSNCEFVPSGYDTRSAVWNAALHKMNLPDDTQITYFEFGVFDGQSLRWWADRNANQESVFFGFDSFEGLPEDWVTGGKSAGTYKTTPGSLDDLDERVTLVPGWFNQSVPKFFSSFAPPPPNTQQIVMFDADLFSSTVTALSGITMHRSQLDQLWIFDEFVPEEARALEIFIKAYGFNAVPVASDERKLHVAFRITSSS